jgi:Copine
LKFQQSKGQAYTVLLLFSNGQPQDVSKTIVALKEVSDMPLSVVLVRVGGSGDFSALTTIDNLQFVDYDALKGCPGQLTQAALDHIPSKLEAYFKGRNIYPNPEPEPEDIAVVPFNEAEEVQVPISISETGEPTVTGAAHAPASKPINVKKMANQAKKMGRMIRQGVKRKEFGKIKREINKISNQTIGMRIL